MWRLLRRNISAVQLTGYAVANLAGLLIVVTSLQFYSDITSGGKSGDDALISDDYLIVSKRVEGLGSIFGGGTSGSEFSESEIEELRKQPWVKNVGSFRSADFNVYAGVDFGGRSMSTALFLESVPDEYFDVSLPDWHFDPATDNTVPIILSKDYLALYNFGFAPSRGMPQISENMIGMVPLKLSVSGRGRQRLFNGRIVGFSSRLNTIAVPDGFLSWANDNFGENSSANPSRLIIKTDSPGNLEAEKFLASRGYEIGGDKAGSGRAAYVMKLITTVVVAIGAVISCLALVILLLSVSLLLQKNREKISTLLTLGYSPSQVASYYIRIVTAVNAAVLVLAVAGMFIARSVWMPQIEAIGASGATVTLSVITGLVVMLVVTAINALYIRHSTRRLF